MDTTFKAVTIPNLISKEEAAWLVNFAEGIEQWEYGGSDFWDNRSLNAINIYEQHNKEVGKFLFDLRNKMSQEIESVYGNPVYPDLLQIVRWFPGQEQSPHADDMTNSNEEGLEWFHHRHYGSILYLNDNYDGGHTYYPQHNFEIKPEVGTLAVHPGDPDHMHGVTKVTGGIRYTIASFWSRNPEFFDGWTIPNED